MTRLTEAEDAYLRATTGCRIATVDSNGMPHAVPVRYAWDGQYAYITTDPGSKKHRNLQQNPRAAIIVDELSNRSGVLLQGDVELIADGEDYVAAQQVLIERGALRRLRAEGEQIVIRFRPSKVVSWRVNP